MWFINANNGAFNMSAFIQQYFIVSLFVLLGGMFAVDLVSANVDQVSMNLSNSISGATRN